MGSEAAPTEPVVVPVPEEVLAGSRIEMMERLISKRESFVEARPDRTQELTLIRDETTPLVEDARKERDAINVEVAKLKGQREMLYDRRNAARQKFHAMIKTRRNDNQLLKELDGLNTRLSEVDWDIQTTALTVEEEASGIKASHNLLEELEAVMKEMESLDQRNSEIEEATRTITNSIREAQQAHELLLQKVKEANKFHDLWKEYVQTLRNADVELKESERRHAAHPKAIAYWKKRIDEENKLEAQRQKTAALAAAEKKGPLVKEESAQTPDGTATEESDQAPDTAATKGPDQVTADVGATEESAQVADTSATEEVVQAPQEAVGGVPIGDPGGEE